MQLKAGHLSAHFSEGFLRHIHIGDLDILTMIYFAVRDANWATIKQTIKNIKIDTGKDHFEIHYDCLCKEGAIDFRWQCEITGEPNRITFSIHGTSHSHFLRNRIGFCILHPISLGGSAVSIGHPDGSQTAGRFPEFISPHQPFKNITSMSWEIGKVKAHLQFEGEVFETEDQRNWLDASFKTYCTPLDLPFPVEVNPSNNVDQKVTLSFEVPHNFSSPMRTKKYKLEVLGKVSPLPSIGVEANEEELDPISIRHLKALNMSHLRVDAHVHEEGWQVGFEKRVLQARQLQLAVELVFFANEESWIHLRTVSEMLKGLHIQSILPIDVNSRSTSPNFMAKAIPSIKAIFANAPIGGGTDFYFTELNRFHPPFELLDFVSFSINPQVHAFDDTSILETIQTHSEIIKSAKHIAKELPIHVSPITLKPRTNPDATERISKEKQRLQRIDQRQCLALNALWTLGGFKHLVQSGVKQLTYFQTVGEEGLMMANRAPEFDFFPAHTHDCFPVYEVFKILTGFKAGNIIHSISNDMMAFEGMVLEKDNKKHYLLFNFSKESLTIEVEGKSFFLKEREICLKPV